MKSTKDKKVIIGMSGGVDSSVAAYLLRQQGYQVEGLFMKNWEADDDDGCSATQDLADATAVCTRIGVPLHTINFSKEYWDKVFRHFLEGYQQGFTPNPDILCNKEIKFKAFLDHAIDLGADFIATGHYARIKYDGHYYRLNKAKDRNKDQSYFLYTLGQAQLKKALFPLADQLKTAVRDIAKQQNFINHNKKDSTGICFIGERKFKDFLSEYLLSQPGIIKTTDGKTIGEHDGLMYYTLGQRQGLHIGGLKDAGEAPWYVVAKDSKSNVLVVAQGQQHPCLYSQGLMASDVHWVTGRPPEFPLACQAKIRYRQLDQACLVTRSSDKQLTVMFADKQRAVTPGQSIVFYQQSECLGGGIILEAIS